MINAVPESPALSKAVTASVLQAVHYLNRFPKTHKTAATKYEDKAHTPSPAVSCQGGGGGHTDGNATPTWKSPTTEAVRGERTPRGAEDRKGNPRSSS